MSFYVTGGTLGPKAASYVQREADHQLLDALLRGEFCYVLTSRQMGKSSLMVRATNRLHALGITVAALDLTAIGAQDVTPEQWYSGLLDLLGESIGLSDALEAFWQKHQNLGPIQRLFTAIREVVLPSLGNAPELQIENLPTELSRPARAAQTPVQSRVRLVIFLDEIDILRSLPFSGDGLLAAIRECYNRRARDTVYESVAFCLLGVATPTDLIRDMGRTPFNIGRRIELNDFTPEEAEPLAQGLVTPEIDPPMARLLLNRMLYWTGGHPYMTQRLCKETADALQQRHVVSPPRLGPPPQWANNLVDPLCSELFLSDGAVSQDPNLSFVSEHLLRNELGRPMLLGLYRKVRKGACVPDDALDKLATQLRLAGIVRASAGRLVVRNRIYARVFDREWVRANMPGAELRRERDRYRRVTVLSLCLVAVMIGLTSFAFIARNNQRNASTLAYVSGATAQRMSGRAGQRISSLEILNKARPYYQDHARLRDEAASALTLMDLRPDPRWVGKITAVSSDLSVAARVEPDDSVTLFNPANVNSASLGKLSGLNPKPRRLRFSPQSNVLLVEHEIPSEGRLTVWDWTKGHQILALDNRIPTPAVDFTADGRELAVGTTNGAIQIYLLPSGTRADELPLRTALGTPRIANIVRFSPSGELLAEACGDEWGVRIWRVTDHRQFGDDLFHPAPIYDLAWANSGRLLVTACGDGNVHVWKTNDLQKEYAVLRGHSDAVFHVACSHIDSLAASVGRDHTVRLWSLASERQLVTDKCMSTDEIQFSARDDHLICSGLSNTTVNLLAVHGGEHITLRAEGAKLEARNTLDFSADGRHLLAALSGQIVLFDLVTLQEIIRLPVEKTHGAFFTSDGQVLECSDRGMFRYPVPRFGSDPPPGKQLPEPPAELTELALSPDRRRCAAVHLDEVLVFDTTTGSLVRSNVVGRHYYRLALHPQERWLAGMIKDRGQIELWNLNEKAARDPWKHISTSGGHFTFDPSGRWLITSTPTGFKLLDLRTTQEHEYPHAQNEGYAEGPIAVSLSGTLLAVAHGGDSIELWRLPQDKEQLEPEVITTLDARNHLESLAFSPDGVWLGAVTKDTKEDRKGPLIELWNLKRLWIGLKPYLEKRFERTL
jgi:WD40 repeat protein